MMMKAKVIIVICACAAACFSLCVYGCSTIVNLCTSEQASLDYVGKIRFGEPVTIGRRTTIPVGFEGGRWNENSGIVFKKFKTSRYEYEIFVTAVTCLAGGGGDLPKHEISMKNLRPGRYPVYYLDPDGSKHEIGAIEVGVSKK